MADTIQLLPDAIANQIAAGEVIQRPASVVKELMENAVDAGATNIKLLVKDAGRTLIQVIDNGCGLSETDARMSFERHATSKIKKADDLFSIRTMGFRGEALASIAAIAQVEMRSRRSRSELGSRLQIEGSEVRSQEPCQCAAGTSIAVKNLFYNVPARRNFLKSDTVEMRHIMEEFQRIALAHHDLYFSMHHNQSEVFHLPPGNLRQRVTGIMGGPVNKKLVPVFEETEAVKITGFVGKPEYAKKTRGEQYFFVNQRFIKSGYLHHALLGAYEGMLTEKTHPLYVIFLQIDPADIDINVHPTKQEIKFEDERLVYQYLRVAVRHALGQHAVMPTLDFDQEPSFSGQRPGRSEMPRHQPSADDFGPTSRPGGASGSGGPMDWNQLYQGLDVPENRTPQQQDPLILPSKGVKPEQESGSEGHKASLPKAPYQLHQRYIVSQIKSGFVLIDQQAAHERILFEDFQRILKEQAASSQKQLFPRQLSLSPADTSLLRELLSEVNRLGFDIQEFGLNTFVVNGVPAEVAGKAVEQSLVEDLLEQFKANKKLELSPRDNLARSLARSASLRPGKPLEAKEMQSLIDRLFACENPFKSPSGKQCFLTFELEELARRFEG